VAVPGRGVPEGAGPHQRAGPVGSGDAPGPGSGARLLDVGRVDRPHGLRGEVVVDLWSNVAARLDPGSVLVAGDRAVRVVASRPIGGRHLVRFEGIGDRPAAESLRGVVLRAEPVEVPGALWVHELVGAEVVDVRGRRLGRVRAVEANPASDLLVLHEGGLVPLRFVVEHLAGRVVVDVPAGLLE